MATRSLIKKLNLEKDQLIEESNQQSKLQEDLKAKIYTLNGNTQGLILVDIPYFI